MMPKEITFGNVRVELVGGDAEFLGLGAIRIGDTQVRSSALPMRPFAEGIFGHRFEALHFIPAEPRDGGTVIRARMSGRRNDWEVRLDHSLDRIITTGGWDGAECAHADLEIVLKPSRLVLDGRTYEGFTYHFRFVSEHQDIWLLVDRSTWEIGGAITGNTYIGQVNFGLPSVTYRLDTAHSTEGIIDFPLNPQMTQAMPRWAGAPSVDYLHRGNDTLVLWYDRVHLIRSVMKKDAGENHLKFFEQHYFDYGRTQETVPRHVLLETSRKSDDDHRNLWTRWHDFTGDRARAEFGMTESDYHIVLGQNFWDNFTFESYYIDTLPVARALHFGAVFIDPIWQNDMTKTRTGEHRTTGKRYGNMCCPWELEIADVLGGVKKLKRLVDDFHACDTAVISWLGTHVSNLYYDPFKQEQTVLRLPDGRHHYGSGYDAIWGQDLNTSFRDTVVESLGRARTATGIDGFLYDSFYNFGFMPVSFREMKPRTQFRACLRMMAELQKQGQHMMIESLGPWTQNQHGCSAAYSEDVNDFIRYKGLFSPGYATIPTGQEKVRLSADAQKHFRLVSGKSQLNIPLFINDHRIDTVMDPLYAATNRVYKSVRRDMAVRTLVPEGRGALWATPSGNEAILWSYAAGTHRVPTGTTAVDLVTGEAVRSQGDALPVRAYGVYRYAAGPTANR